jgi:hypothetical protein
MIPRKSTGLVSHKSLADLAVRRRSRVLLHFLSNCGQRMALSGSNPKCVTHL